MFYEEAKQAENALIEERKAECRKGGFEMTFEHEVTLRFAFARGWDAIAERAFKAGQESAKARVRSSFAATPEPLP